MDRWACVDVPALPLQLLLRRQPTWGGQPVVVVAEDKPTAAILWANEQALRRRIWPGRRYAEGLALDTGLRAGVVSAAEIEAAVEELLGVLRQHSPEVEPSVEEPGVFWLNASGIAGLFPSLQAWAARLADSVRAVGLRAAVVVGFDRFATYALARASAGDSPSRGSRSRTSSPPGSTPSSVRVIDSRREERRLVDRVPLHRLGIAAALRDAMHRLGVEDVGAFRRLPAGSLRVRFGEPADRLHRLARGVLAAPLAPRPERPPVCERMEREPGEHGLDAQGLVFLCKQRLARIAQVLAAQGLAISALHLRLLREKAPPREESVRPAEPTLDEVQLVDLLRLRLDSLRLEAEPEGELEGFELTAEAVPATASQRQLFAAAHGRDLAAANRALARVRADLGEDAVVRAVVRDGHLPEASFDWQRLDAIASPRPEVLHPSAAAGLSPRLVRRILDRPRLLPRSLADDRRDRGVGRGSGGQPLPDVRALAGPFVCSGGWWRREQHREYYYATTRHGDLLWVYYDRCRRSWFLHGVVE